MCNQIYLTSTSVQMSLAIPIVFVVFFLHCLFSFLRTFTVFAKVNQESTQRVFKGYAQHFQGRLLIILKYKRCVGFA